MKMRGKLLREPNGGPGLLMAQGQQYKFSLEGVWKSQAAPKAGQDLDVDLDQNMQVVSLSVVTDSQIAKEQAEQAMAKVKEQGGKIVGQAVAKFGVPNLVAAGCLIVGWLWLTTASIALPMVGKMDFSFWQILQMINASNPAEIMDRASGSAGIYGFIAIVALLGPFVHYFWKDKRAVLGGLAPLLFMIVIAILARSSFMNAFTGGASISPDFGDMAKQAQAEAMKAISLGLGAYLSGLASLYFAAIAAKQFLLSRAATAPAPAKPNQAAA